MARVVHYISNKKLYEAMVAYKETVVAAKANGTERPQIPNYIGECFYMIARRLATKANFASYSYSDEMISDGIEDCVRYIDTFDPKRTNNPFAYFTQTIKNAFIRRIQKEKKQQIIKIENMSRMYQTDEIEAAQEETNRARDNKYQNEITHEFVRNYHDAIEKKKKPKVVKPVGIEKIMDN